MGKCPLACPEASGTSLAGEHLGGTRPASLPIEEGAPEPAEEPSVVEGQRREGGLGRGQQLVLPYVVGVGAAGARAGRHEVGQRPVNRQVAPAELESVLLSHPAVADAAVVPLADEACGEIPRAFVVLKGPATAEELMAFVASKVAPYKKVRRLEFIDAIPKSPSGKILRRLLRDMAVV